MSLLSNRRLYSCRCTTCAKVKLLTLFLICLTLCADAQVRIVSKGDTLKGNIKRVTEYRFNWIDTIKSVHNYDIEGSETVTFYSSKNVFLGKERKKVDGNGRIKASGFYYKKDTLCDSFTYQYDAFGREIEQLSKYQHCGQCNCLRDILSGSIANWISGEFTSFTQFKSEYDHTGNLVKTNKQTFRTWSSAEDPYTDTAIETTVYNYKRNGKVAGIKKENFEIRQGRRDTTLEITEFRYNDSGNKVEEVMFKKGSDNWLRNWHYDGKEVTTRTLFKYDTRNNLIESDEYFFEEKNNNPHVKTYPGVMVGAGTRYTYDSLNNMTSSIFYRLYRHDDGTETEEGASVSNVKKREKEKEGEKEYDDRGNIIKITNDGTVWLRRVIEYF